MPDFAYEDKLTTRGFARVAGVDEAGRGPLAGPVAAAAAILPRTFSCPSLNDSKKLSKKLREDLYLRITNDSQVVWAVAFVEVAEIDSINILRATHRAMALALSGLSEQPEIALVDGLPVKGLPVGHESLVKGDELSLSIAAASVIAKVTRDRIMAKIDAEVPEYGFIRNQGYATREHLEALSKHGPCRHHRRSFSRYLNSPYHSGSGAGDPRKRTGDYGEKVAADWLRARNCKVLARNFKGRKGGEVDIVAREGRQLLFTEVKTRRKDAKVRGLAAVNRKKQQLIRRGANEWLRRLGTREVPWRFDVIEVEVSEGEKPVVRRIENVFQNSSSRRKW